MIDDNSTQYILDLERANVRETSDYVRYGLEHEYNNQFYDVHGRYLYALNKHTGEETKKRLFKDERVSSVLYENLLVVAIHRKKGIHAVDLDTLEVIWSIENPELLNIGIELTLVDGILYYLNDGIIYGLDPKSGVVLLEYKGEHYPPFLIDSGHVFTSGDTIKKVDMITGEFIKSKETKCYSMIVDESSLYAIVTSDENYLQGYDKNSLELKWSTPIYDSSRRKLMQTNDYIIVLNSNMQVALINKQTGEVEWIEEFQSGDSVYGYKNYLVIISESGRIQYFDTTAQQN